jgi:hypothetical protein
MVLGLASGCAFPAQALPDFLRHHVTPWLPPNWFVECLHSLESGSGPFWGWTAFKLALLGALLSAIAARLLHHHLRQGLRA